MNKPRADVGYACRNESLVMSQSDEEEMEQVNVTV